jgi:hypothetical protein
MTLLVGVTSPTRPTRSNEAAWTRAYHSKTSLRQWGPSRRAGEPELRSKFPNKLTSSSAACSPRNGVASTAFAKLIAVGRNGGRLSIPRSCNKETTVALSFCFRHSCRYMGLRACPSCLSHKSARVLLATTKGSTSSAKLDPGEQLGKRRRLHGRTVFQA